MTAIDLPENRDLLVVGAGAAGLAAAARARELGLDTLLLEAKDRIGGRCYTDTRSIGLPWDRGAHWMHQARSNPFVAIARSLGHKWTDAPRSVRHWLADEGRWASPDEAKELATYIDACYRAIEAAGKECADRSVAEVIPVHDRWQPFAEGWLQALNGCEVEEISVRDYVRYREDDANWPLDQGYGGLLAAYHQNTEVLLNTPVQQIDWAGTSIQVKTPRGSYRSRYLIVTLPTPLLARSELFVPPLPPDKRQAAAALPLGQHEKLALRFDQAALPEESHWYFQRIGTRRAALNGIYRPFGRPMILLHLGGSLLRDWKVETAAEAKGPALEFLEQMLGRPLRPHLRAWSATAWAQDPCIRGSYSSALPGEAQARELLARPLENRLFFAGEACSIPAFGTVHGAHLTGIAAAEQVHAVRSRHLKS